MNDATKYARIFSMCMILTIMLQAVGCFVQHSVAAQWAIEADAEPGAEKLPEDEEVNKDLPASHHYKFTDPITFQYTTYRENPYQLLLPRVLDQPPEHKG